MNYPENDALLSALLKLVNGDKERCDQLTADMKQRFPGKGEKWCIDKVVYDLRWGHRQVNPNPTLARWTDPKPHAPTPKPQSSVSQLPQPPAPQPNPDLDIMSTSTAELTALMQQRQQPATLKHTPKTLDIHAANGVTKQELYRLAGNQNVAHRLVESNCLRYSDRSVQWAWEKAISDLERDRL